MHENRIPKKYLKWQSRIKKTCGEIKKSMERGSRWGTEKKKNMHERGRGEKS